jgi:hypothetical protein
VPFVTHFFVDFYSMFRRLQQKWNVTGKQFIVIFIVFAITGTTTAFLTKAITSLLGFDDTTSWFWKFLLRLGMLLIGYWVLLLGFGALLGQWKFFSQFVKKLLQRIGIIKKDKTTAKMNNDSNEVMGKIKAISNK